MRHYHHRSKSRSYKRLLSSSKYGRIKGDDSLNSGLYLNALIAALLKRKLPFEPQHLQHLLSTIASDEHGSAQPLANVLGAVKAFIHERGMLEVIHAELVKVREATTKWTDYADTRKVRLTIESLLKEAVPEQPTGIRFTTGEPWTRALQESLNPVSTGDRLCWDAFLLYCNSAKSPKPTQKWLKQAGKLIDDIGPEGFVSRIQTVLAEIGKPGPPPKRHFAGHRIRSRSHNDSRSPQ